MEAKELRIGNYVMFGNDEVQFDIHIRDIFKPIPLTEEWLQGMGCDYIREGDFHAYHLSVPVSLKSVATIRFVLILDTWQGEYRVDGKEGSGYLYHVHQVQNLYYALCGEELKIRDI